ncbi:MAG: 16S rRNA (cytidine(1402)-2'-O)-methyltransferase [Chthoniobacterales bacterium]|nr:16S rRNA (cytidine(1402)-2'-O)-methyltransferase [Chthoniobacterales bacterium]
MLLIVSTPIGNLGDLSPRAAQALQEADIIAAEDTRRTNQLLAYLKLKKSLLSLHDHNESTRVPIILSLLNSGKTVAMVSDSGTPLLSDPGYRVLKACIEHGIAVSTIPGPSAITAAITCSGLPPYPFYFGGFLPSKPGARQKEIQAALQRNVTHVYFESPHRLAKTLHQLASLSPDCPVCVAREITKKFEQFHRGSASELAAHYHSDKTKGEITIVFSPQVQSFQ